MQCELLQISELTVQQTAESTCNTELTNSCNDRYVIKTYTMTALQSKTHSHDTQKQPAVLLKISKK